MDRDHTARSGPHMSVGLSHSLIAQKNDIGVYSNSSFTRVVRVVNLVFRRPVYLISPPRALAPVRTYAGYALNQVWNAESHKNKIILAGTKNSRVSSRLQTYNSTITLKAVSSEH